MVILLIFGGSCLARQNAEHSSGALATFQHFHLSISPDASPFSLCPLLHLPPLFTSVPSFPFFPPLLPVSFPLSVSLSLWLLIGCLSACGSCVFVCNRAERLVWIQRWENLFIWEMHRWRQVSRHRGLSPAVILHSGPDRRSEMGKYARRSAQIPELHLAIQPMCVSVYSYLTQWLCVCECFYVGRHTWSDSPATCSVQSPLPLSDRGEKV